MTEVATDERGRITIPKAVRDRLGERYRLVELRDEVKLLPVPDDPVASLRDASSEAFKRATMEELQETAHERARAQTSDRVR
ncbi:AbrB/MazE/SpoVT family DNA-binding domain-containing protein [Natronobiforma cellulositropha]|uniref:AbrB/MazE/SpoVT family DNA-binding domain-containing protein n=1 Tax=Natronobiforma cellulositropha TaxID=1679076 RepID=UPI0021D5CC2F|nr:AbrB/MazE/SpoVT family DNA-binding domain-containing protein [Natronobiforma cellulositropha]